MGWKIIWFILIITSCVIAVRWMPDKDERMLGVMALTSPLFFLHGLVDIHLDVLVGFTLLLSFLALRQNKVLVAGIILGIGISLKYLPIVALPFFLIHLRGRPLRTFALALVATVGLAYMPFLGDNLWGNTGNFLERWFANSLAYKSLVPFLSKGATRLVLAALMIGAAGVSWLKWRDKPAFGLTLALIGIMLFSPVVHAWYLLPALLLFPVAQSRSVIVWTATSCVYLFFVADYQVTGVWTEPYWMLHVETMPVVIAWFWDLVRGPLTLCHAPIKADHPQTSLSDSLSIGQS